MIVKRYFSFKNEVIFIQVSHVKKGEKQVSEEYSGHRGQLRPKRDTPSILEWEFARLWSAIYAVRTTAAD